MSQKYGIKQSLHKLAIKYAAPKLGEPTPEHVCAPCEREKKIAEASSFCKECNEKLCLPCLGHHKKFQILNSHQVVTVTEEFGEPKPKIVTKLTEKCPVHDKILNQYCAKDDEICCETCISTRHKDCGDPDYIMKAAVGILKSTLPKETKEGIQRIKKDLFMLKMKRIADKNRIVKEKDQVLDMVTSLRKRMDDALNRLEHSARTKLAMKFQSDMRKIKHDIRSCDDSLAELDEILRKLRTDQEIQMFLRIKYDAKHGQEKGENIINELNNNLGTEKINFEVDETLELWLDNLVAFGKFDDDQVVFSGSLYGEYNASFKKDANQVDYIFNSVINLPDGRTALSDWENRKLKLFDPAYKQIDYIDLPGEPFAITFISSNEIITTLRDEKTIQFVSVGEKGQMTLTKKFKVEEYPRGIGYLQDEIYITCGGGIGEVNGQLRVYSMSGELIRFHQDDSHGQRIFLSPKDVIINVEKSRIHVVDRKRGIITMTTDGRVVSVFCDPHLVDPCGLAIDDQGNLFAVGSSSNIILQLTGDGVKVAEVLHEADGIDHVLAVCCHVTVPPRLIVTMEHCKEFKVFALEEK